MRTGVPDHAVVGEDDSAWGRGQLDKPVRGRFQADVIGPCQLAEMADLREAKSVRVALKPGLRHENARRETICFGLPPLRGCREPALAKMRLGAPLVPDVGGDQEMSQLMTDGEAPTAAGHARPAENYALALVRIGQQGPLEGGRVQIPDLKNIHGHRERLDRNRRRPVRVMPQDRLDQPLGRAAVRQIHEELAHDFFNASAMARTAAQALSSSLPSNSR